MRWIRRSLRTRCSASQGRVSPRYSRVASSSAPVIGIASLLLRSTTSRATGFSVLAGLCASTVLSLPWFFPGFGPLTRSSTGQRSVILERVVSVDRLEQAVLLHLTSLLPGGHLPPTSQLYQWTGINVVNLSMAKRQRLDPAITERYVAELRSLTRARLKRAAAVKEIEEQIEATVRAAFAAGVKGGPPVQAPGVSGSRAFHPKVGA